MTSMLALLCVGWFSFAAAWSVNMPAPYALEDADLHFERFIQEFERNYADEHEKQYRFQIFKENLNKINSLNAKSKHAVYGVTQFSDLSHEEFKAKITCLRKSDSQEENNNCTAVYDKDIHYNDAPESWDWRDHGAVTPIKDQGVCGSCYAFSAIGNIESQYAIKHKQLISLSEQQVVDCDKIDWGCAGGNMDVVMRVLIDEGGVEASADYPYLGRSGTCRFDANKVKVKLSDCNSYNLTSQETLKQLLYHNGPLSIGIQGIGLQEYKRGIISDDDCDVGDINHGVLLVGYGSDNGVPYWIVKNSWGMDFGEDGYFRMHRGENAKSCSMMKDIMPSAVVE